jgi:hypothetical protein
VKKSAGVYKRKNDFIIHPYSRTTVGLWIGSGSPISCNINSQANELGDTLTRALSESKTNVPHPKDAAEWKASNVPILKFFKAKSFSSAMKGAFYCNIEDDGGILLFTPYRNMGAKNGFVPILEKEIKIPSDSCMEEIGNTLLKAFESCE